MGKVTVLSREAVLAGAETLTGFGLEVTLRQRSFNKERGSFFWKLDVFGQGEVRTPDELARSIERNTPALEPIKVRGTIANSRMYISFVLPDGSTLSAPDGTGVWSLQELVNAKGRRKVGKQEYLLLAPSELFFSE